MINSNYVTYDQALKLKQIGFDLRTLTYFEDDSVKLHNHLDGWDFNKSFINCVSRPTYQQAYEYFRNKFGYEPNIQCYPKTEKIDHKFYSFTVEYDHDSNKTYAYIEYELDEDNWKTYDEVQSICLDIIIEHKLNN